MGAQALPLEEFFIYVPLLKGVESLNIDPDSGEENALSYSAHEAWVKIPLAQQLVVYAHICGEDENGVAPFLEGTRWPVCSIPCSHVVPSRHRLSERALVQ